MKGEPAPSRGDFRNFMAVPTRWMDDDANGHVNDITYYSYFDTAVNHYLIEAGGLDMQKDPGFGGVAETGCRFFANLSSRTSWMRDFASPAWARAA